MKNVKVQFPNLIISADLFADKNARQGVGQAGIPQYLNIAMPMAYSYSSSNDEDSTVVKNWITEFQNMYGNMTIVPIIRGFAETGFQTNRNLISDVAADLQAVKSANASGYAIFRYETLLIQTGNKKLSLIKGQIGF
jgi:hypothetical protein